MSIGQEQGGAYRRRPGAPRRGFSLIELVVSIGVLLVLVGIMMPALHQAIKVTAPRIECSNNLYQIHNAIQLHLNDHSDEYPVAAFYWPRRNQGMPPLYEVIGGYLNDEEETWTCPADSRWAESRRIYGSYVYPLAVKLYDNSRVREGGILNQRFPLLADRGLFHGGRDYRRPRDNATDEVYLVPAGQENTQFEFRLRNGMNRLMVNGKVTTENPVRLRGSGGSNN